MPEPWLIAAIVLLGAMVFGLVLVVAYREWCHVQAIRSFGESVGKLPPTVETLGRSLNDLSARLDRQFSDEKERNRDLHEAVRDAKHLVIDVERRLAEVIRDTKSGGHFYNSHSSGGQVNQGGSVQGEQR